MKTKVFLALFFPIFCLFGLLIQKQHRYQVGNIFYFDITGYDPRDILQGHYIQYNVDYGISNVCQGVKYGQMSYICLEPKYFIPNYNPSSYCPIYIQGICNGTRFEAGIEKYYIPESIAKEKAKELDEALRTKKAKIEVNVGFNGVAQIRSLHLEGFLGL